MPKHPPSTAPLDEEKRRLAVTLNSVGEAVVATDALGNITHMNPMAEALLQTKLSEVVGTPLEESLHLLDATTREPTALDFGDICRAHRRLVRTNMVLVPHPARAAEGEEHAAFERAVTVTWAPIAENGGDFWGCVLVLRDTTDEQRAIAALRRSEASFRAVIEHSPELVAVHRKDCILYVNPAVVASLGYRSGEELARRSFLTLVHPDDRAGAPVHLDGAASSMVPLRWVCRDGTFRMTEALAMPVDWGGAPATVVLARDVTERNEIHAQLLRVDRMAALGTLAAGVAHEINNPLTYLLVNVEHVLRRVRALAASNNPIEQMEGEEGAKLLTSYAQSLSQAVDGANRVRQIVKDLMTFSQGNVEHRGLVDLRGVVESAIQMAWHEIRHRARLTKNLQEVPPVEANEARLGQVFLNLLVNAAQAIPEGHANENEVRVATRVVAAAEGEADERRVVIEVSDTGEGIDPSVLPRIFDPFFTTKRAGAGMGLGLSISHGIVKSLGGEMTVESAPGKGTLFRVILPAARGYRTRSPSSTPVLGGEPRRRILVIDDEALVTQAIARVLADENDVETATHGAEALHRIQGGEEFDLILCDLMMPVMTGMDFYAEVVRVAPHLAGRIVFMTGGAFTARARAFVESVSNPCLEKPLEMSKLRSLIARMGERAGR